MGKVKSIFIGILLVVSILAIIDPVSAATREVGDGKTYTTIGAAITAAADGDTILVYPGTYNENVEINKSNITLKSVGGRDSTIIGPGTEPRVIDIKRDLGTITVDGFTVLLSKTIEQPEGIVQGMASETGTTSIVKNNKVLTQKNLRNGIQVAGENSQVIGNIITGGPLNEDYGSSGILIVSNKIHTKNILVKDNHILDRMDYGISIITWGNKGGEVSDTVVEGNIVEKTVYAGITIGGKVGNTLVKDNIIKNNPVNGLEELHNNNRGDTVGNPTGTKVWYNQFCNNGKDIDIYDDPNDSYFIGDPKLDARGNTGCPTTLPMNKFLSILRNNRCKNHPDLEGCKVIATENYVKIDGSQLKQLIENKENIYLIDVRTEQMYSDGHISGATNVPYSKLGDMISTIPKDRKVVLYCKTGQTSIKSAEFLVKNNFDNIYVVTDGYDILLGLGIK